MTHHHGSRGSAAKAAPSDRGEILRLREVAARWRVNVRTVQKWVAAGRLRVLRLGPKTIRVTEEDLADFIRRARGRAS